MIACAIYEATYNFVLFDIDTWRTTAADEIKHENEFFVSKLIPFLF